jgi:hypothetical protein
VGLHAQLVWCGMGFWQTLYAGEESEAVDVEATACHQCGLEEHHRSGQEGQGRRGRGPACGLRLRLDPHGLNRGWATEGGAGGERVMCGDCGGVWHRACLPPPPPLAAGDLRHPEDVFCRDCLPRQTVGTVWVPVREWRKAPNLSAGHDTSAA